MATSGHAAVVVDIDIDEPASCGGNADAAGTRQLLPPVVLPPVTYVLRFTDLSYSVKKRGGGLGCLLPRRRPSNRLASSDAPAPAPSDTTTKTLLDGISGEARDGELLAVMGASGSGKSTLVDALAGRIARGSLRGGVTLNGEPLQGRRLRAISAHVMQDDLLHPMLTVRETLRFAAEFRLPRALPADRKRARVDALVDQLGLARAADTIIGDEARRGVSGGERRRVSIGTDIIHDPILLFLDEPTSGLDSASAFMVVQVLRRIARSGSVVIMTVHQPSARILGILDRLLLLSRGRTVYAGTPAGLKPFFAAFGAPIPDNENPAEFALDTIREYESSPGGAAPLADFNVKWQRGGDAPAEGKLMPLELAIAESVSRGKLVAGSGRPGGGGGGGAATGSSVPTFANPPWTEVWVLIKRSFTNTGRMPELFLMRLGTIMVTGFILATIFWRLDDSPKGVQERLGFFAMAMSTTFYVCADALPVFVQERHIYLRETAHNAYRRASYVLANAVVAFPPLVLLSLAFAVTTFWAVGLAGGGPSFLFFVLIILASFWAGSGFVTFLSAVVPHVMLGYTVVVAILAYFLLFSGFFINRDRIPDYWIWFHYLSLVKYPYQAVLQNEFSDASRCFTRGVEMFEGTPIAHMTEAVKLKVMQAISDTLGSNLTANTCVTTGADVLAQQAVTDIGKWNCLLVTVAWGFFFRALFYVVLLVSSKNKRK
ncbi:ABC transporter G family member 16 [Zea mays]|uniref:ABC transporter G family member 5 n=1 Tax=Zea mays TaxID=4577 RepID=A0A1D6LH56_MAIZE|nr:ABC transporter G family member 16 [Zea mays]AQK79219.1 ABC transporter G family member 6 [Zea mays]|eukprot:XP_008648601.1 ABC transporter G family member 16 [Zea mays]